MSSSSEAETGPLAGARADAAIELELEDEHGNRHLLDAKSLFLGNRLFRLIEAWRELVLNNRDPSGLYEFDADGGARLRQDYVDQPGQMEGLRLVLTVRHRGQSDSRRYDLAELDQVVAAISAVRLGGANEDRPTPAPGVRFLGHSSFGVSDGCDHVVVDPLANHYDSSPRQVVKALFRSPLSAVFLSHSHWDHCDASTLAGIEKSTPLLIPRITNPHMSNPPLRALLERLGFGDIREMVEGDEQRFGDMTVTAVAFRGEQDEPGLLTEHLTVLVETPERRIYGGVDSFRDSSGDMLDVLSAVARDRRPDIAFMPASHMRYRISEGGVNGFLARFDPQALDTEFQYTASVTDALEMIRALRPRTIVPYALFALERWALPANAAELARRVETSDFDGNVVLSLPGQSVRSGDTGRRAKVLASTAGVASKVQRRADLASRAVQRLRNSRS